ncbi:hypothetical protein [Rhodococcus koreensis]|uniref:hypothetical protein n=1 Tax=Rhodococcus koreensis TaxID=99653 RepID=UPI00366C595F
MKHRVRKHGRLTTPLRITTAGASPSPTIIGKLEAHGVTVVHVYGLTEAYGAVHDL